MKKENKEIIVRLLLSGLVIGALIGIPYLIFYLCGGASLTQEDIRRFVESTGVVAPLVFILITFMQVTLIPIPSTVTILAGNYIFGPWLSFLYSYIGLIIGSMFAFWLGRKLGRPFVDWIAGDKAKVDNLIKKLKGREIVVLFFMFFLPAFPDDLLCSIAGILPVGFGVFMLMQLTTRVTSIGATLIFISGEIIPYEGWGLVVLAILAILIIVAFVLGIKYAVQINEFLDNLIDKLFKRHARNKSEADDIQSDDMNSTKISDAAARVLSDKENESADATTVSEEFLYQSETMASIAVSTDDKDAKKEANPVG